MSEWDDVMGSKAPEGGHSKNEGNPYKHWADPKAGSTSGEHSVDKRAFEDDRAGMEGDESPEHEIFERERGDSSAKGRNVDAKFEGEPFDVNQYDRGDERTPKGHSEGESAPRRKHTEND